MRTIIRKIFNLLTLPLFIVSCDKSSNKENQSFNSKINFYTVYFNTHGGSTISTQQVQNGGKITKPEDPIRLGYEFINWTCKGEVWSFVGYSVTEDMTLDANWDVITYSITYNLDDGINNPSNPSTYTIESEFSFYSPIKAGYTFLGWYDNEDNKITSITKGTIGPLTLTAKWNEGNSYMVTLDPDGGSVSETTIAVQYNHEYNLPTPTRLGYTFDGWFDNSANICNSGIWTYENDKTFTAHWSVITYSITYNLNGGNNSPNNPLSYTVEDEIVLATPSFNFHTFDGWYNMDNKIVKIEKGTTGDIFLDAKWFQTEQQMDDEDVIKFAKKPILSEDGKTITYGLYPQTVVNNSSLVANLNKLTTAASNGWYLYERGYYARLNDTWFKCEPIIWNVLSKNNYKYYILSSVLLDAHNYYNSTSYRTIEGKGVYPNNYKYSDIRKWLNFDFLNSAFALNSSYILTTNVDNSASTTNSSSNSYICDNTQDKIFLPSYSDYSKVSLFGSSGQPSRKCKTTDWSRARGAQIYSQSGEYANNSFYWTRSPSSDLASCAWGVMYNGDMNSYGCWVTNTNCVRPGLYITLN